MLSKKTVSLVVASLVIMIVGCSNNNSNDTKKSVDKKVATSEEIKGPNVGGYVTETISNRAFLLEVTSGDQIFQTGTLIQIGVDDETMLDKLEVGQNVTVWYGGPIYESYPPKTKGLKIKIKDGKK